MNTQSDTTASNTALIQSIYAAFGRGDLAFIAAHVTADTHWDFCVSASEVPWHQPVTGPEGVANFLGAFKSGITLTSFEPRHFVAAGDDVIVNVGLSYKVNRSGREVSEDQIQWWTVRAGRVSRLRHYEDTAQVIAAWAA